MNTFTKNDVNLIQLDINVRREALGLFNNPTNQRSFQELYDTVEKGIIAERYLIEHFGYTNNTKKYHDVIDPNGIEVEIKVIEDKWCTPHFIETDPHHRNLKHWMDADFHDSNFVLVFSRKNNVYSFYKCYSLLDGTER